MASIQQTPNGPVIVLKESALQEKGRDAQKNNIMAAKLVGELVKSSLGPRGLDKMLVDSLGDVTITNDGATILKAIDAQHPAAKMMVEISKVIDTEVGEMWMWSGATLMHGNKINDTGKSRVSVDFRVIPTKKYKDSNRISVTNKTKMIIGEYWNESK